MKFVIFNQDNKEVVSEHDSLDEAKRIYGPYFLECRSGKKLPINWIAKQRADGEIVSLPDKEQTKLRMFFVKS